MAIVAGLSPLPRSAETPARRAPVRVDDLDGIRLLRRSLTDAGYSQERFMGVFSKDVPPAPRNRPVWVRRLPRGDPLATQIKLLYLGVRVAVEEAADAFEPLELDRLAAMGVIAVEADGVRGEVSITPVEHLLIASDWPEAPPKHRDYVMPIAPPTVLLAAVTVRRAVAAALDIGCGSGLQALFAAQHAREVVAVDINRRALDYAAFNVVLNGTPNVRLLEGSLFEPVEGRTFDLIVSNPPYVVSPEAAFAFRDSGLPGDSFAEGFVRQIPAHLNEGGFAHVIANWIIPPGEHWSAPLRRWVEGSGCDALLLHFRTMDPLDYSTLWTHELEDDPDVYGEVLDRWLGYYGAAGIESLGWGAVILRRRNARNWVWTLEHPPRGLEPAGHHVLRLVAAQDFLDGRDDRALLDAKLTVADDLIVEMAFELRGGERAVHGAMAVLRTGFGFRAQLDEFAAELLPHLDGRRALRQVLPAVAERVGRLPDDHESGALRVVRRFVELGFVVPAPGG